MRSDTPSITSGQVSAFRLRRQHLIDPGSPDDLTDMIGAICGLQAQIQAAAEQAAAIRTSALLAGILTNALETTRTLARTWLMRGTIHIIPSADLPLYIAAIGPAGIRELHRWLGKNGLTPAQIAHASDAVCKALESSPLTRSALAERVVAQIGDHARSWITHAWGGIVKQAALEGRVCFGTTTGSEITFARTDMRFKTVASSSGSDARRTLLDRYLSAYGPATVQSFARWAGIPSREAKQARHDLADEITDITVGDQPMIVRKADIDDLTTLTLTNHVALLPAFDPYLLGCPDKSHLVDEAHSKLVYRKAGWVSATVLVDGRAAGVWSAEQRGKTLNITITPFAASIARYASAIEVAAVPIGRLHGRRVAVRFDSGDG